MDVEQLKQDVSGVPDNVLERVARAYNSREQLMLGERDITDVKGVGESRAEKILEGLSENPPEQTGVISERMEPIVKNFVEVFRKGVPIDTEGVNMNEGNTVSLSKREHMQDEFGHLFAETWYEPTAYKRIEVPEDVSRGYAKDDLYVLEFGDGDVGIKSELLDKVANVLDTGVTSTIWRSEIRDSYPLIITLYDGYDILIAPNLGKYNDEWIVEEVEREDV